MSGVATAAIGGALITGYSNNKAAKTAANARPQFAAAIEPTVNDTTARLKDNAMFQSFSGDRVADFTAPQNQAFGMTDSLVNTLGSQANVANRGFMDFGGGKYIDANPYLENAIAGVRETSLRDLTRNQLPAISNTAVADGGLGGSRQGIAQGLALSDMNRDLINTEAGMRKDQFNTDMSNSLQALINQGNILSGQTAGQNLLFGTGAMQQGQNQDEINARMQAFDEQNNGQYNRDQELLRILMGAPSGTPPTPYQTDPLAAGLGTAIGAQQLLYGQGQKPEIPAYNPNAPTGGNSINGWTNPVGR
jgi:hypothetical protein